MVDSETWFIRILYLAIGILFWDLTITTFWVVLWLWLFLFADIIGAIE